MADLERVKKINERIGLRADGRISVWCAGAWETSHLIEVNSSTVDENQVNLKNLK